MTIKKLQDSYLIIFRYLQNSLKDFQKNFLIVILYQHDLVKYLLLLPIHFKYFINYQPFIKLSHPKIY